MDKTKKFDLKTILMAVAVLALAFSMIFLSACDNTNSTSSSSSSSSSSSDTTTTITDFQTLTNGDFEFGTTDTESDDYPVTTGISWSRSNDSISTSAISSDYSSGIIDTTDDVYKATGADNGYPVISGEGSSAVYYNPHTPYYYGLIKNSYAYSENTDNDDGLPTTGNKILMIHNKVKSTVNKGTAQKYTSAKTIDVLAGEYAKVSVWVLTKDLKTAMDTTEFGAYVSVVNTITNAKAPLVIKNINTNGEWANINIYIEGSSLSSASYKVVLGLGFGSRKVTSEYVEGFAFFDNVTSETISASDYETATSALANENKFTTFVKDASTPIELMRDAENSELKVSLAGKTYQSNGDASANGAYVETKTPTTFNYSLSYDLTSISVDNVYASQKVNTSSYAHADATFGASSEIGEADFSTISSKVSGVENPLGNTAKTLYMIYPKAASHSVDTKTFTLNDGESMILSFYAKVEAENSQTGATVSLVDLGSSSTPIEKETIIKSSFNTTSVEDENTKDWVKFYVYVANNVGDNLSRSFKLKLDFGPTTTITDSFVLPQGYALFTGFSTTALTEDQYSIASNSGSYTGNVALGGDLISGTTPTKPDDIYSMTYAPADALRIENNLSSSVSGYTGVVGKHTMVGGDNVDYTQEQTASGIFNTKYIDAYTTLTADEKTSLKSLTKASEDNEYVQALLINNKSASSYGYLGKANTISASTTASITVRLRVFGDAKAYVYLTDASPLDGFEVLGLSARKWTFDDEVKYSQNEYSVNKNYVQVVNATDCNGDWIDVNFMVTAGENALNYRVEVWNGTRDNSELSSGMIAIESINTASTINMATVKANNKTAQIETIDYQRVPTQIQYTLDGKDAIKYRNYISSTVYTEYKGSKTIIATHATIDVEDSIDERTDSDSTDTSTDTESEETETSRNWALQITSIIIAAVLLISLITVVVRLLLKSKFKKKQKINAFYDRSSRDITNSRIATRKRRMAATTENATPEEDSSTTPSETEDEVKPYDYDNMDNNLPQEPAEVLENAEQTQEQAEESSETSKQEDSNEEPKNN